jgi:hypothetical protein
MVANNGEVVANHGEMVANKEKLKEPGEKPAPLPLHSPQCDIKSPGIEPKASE